MAQLQFRSDDTVRWLEGFGDGSDGDLTFSSNRVESIQVSRFSGTEGNYSGTAQTGKSFTSGMIVLIHQTMVTDNKEKWQFNKILSYTSGTGAVTFKYPLTTTYVTAIGDQTYAQIVECKQYNSITGSGAPYWGVEKFTVSNGYGGIFPIFCKGTFAHYGDMTMTPTLIGSTYTGGYPGGTEQTTNNTGGKTAAGNLGTGGVVSKSPNGNGAGGGSYKSDDYGLGGAGGGNASSGSDAPNGSIGGQQAGNAELTLLSLGGGGGSGGKGKSEGTGRTGGAGAGVIVVVAHTLDLTHGVITSQGENGTGTSFYYDSCGGGGAGGSVLIKCDTAILGTNRIAVGAGTGGQNTDPAGDRGQDGANGSVGRIHIDYKTSLSGSTSPTLSSRQDNTIMKYSHRRTFLL